MLTLWWFLLLALLGGLIISFTSDRQRISIDENRVLQNMPAFSFKTLLNGEFASDFDSFLSDSIPGRNALIGVSNNLLNAVSMNTDDDLYVLDKTKDEVLDFQEEEADPEGEETPQEQTGEETGEDEGEDDNTGTMEEGAATLELVRRDGQGSTLVYTYPRKNIERVAANLDMYAELLPDDGQVLITLVPFPGLARRLYNKRNFYSGWRCNSLDMIDSLTCDKVKCFDTLAILEPHVMAGENLFLYGNHQWNVHGSYYVYCEMMKAQGLTPTPYNEYEYKINRPSNPAYHDLDTYELLYPLAPSKNYRITHINRKEEFELQSYNTATNSSYLYGNLKPWKQVITGFHTGRNALVIGDCFDLSMTQFLLPYYDEVHKTDIRYNFFQRETLGTSLADMIKRYSIDDVYLVFSEANDVNSQTLRFALAENLYK